MPVEEAIADQEIVTVSVEARREESRQFKIHKHIFCSQSSRFRDFFQDELEMNFTILWDVGVEEFVTFSRWLYTKELTVEEAGEDSSETTADSDDSRDQGRRCLLHSILYPSRRAILGQEPNSQQRRVCLVQRRGLQDGAHHLAKMTDAIVDEAPRKVALFLHAKATADAGEYGNEYIITLSMSEDGKLGQGQYDFIDSHTMMQWTAKLGNFGPEMWEKT
ncbi:hypothetical protein AYL99_08107 [Fonsecaea erecta]|uniref:BTB domain-containing protein n=1 Tax=Fonsecaea erecta TaxID=1367422 RepID=A0A178ZC77_9EURO|nr:hypothetical protein AYL99_08107 [Fonsecaea erecta]OAP57369.1 hypothetical protein AYL99_08107 [Fonsecaea erecta]